MLLHRYAEYMTTSIDVVGSHMHGVAATVLGKLRQLEDEKEVVKMEECDQIAWDREFMQGMQDEVGRQLWALRPESDPFFLRKLRKQHCSFLQKVEHLCNGSFGVGAISLFAAMLLQWNMRVAYGSTTGRVFSFVLPLLGAAILFVVWVADVVLGRCVGPSFDATKPTRNKTRGIDTEEDAEIILEEKYCCRKYCLKYVYRPGTLDRPGTLEKVVPSWCSTTRRKKKKKKKKKKKWCCNMWEPLKGGYLERRKAQWTEWGKFDAKEWNDGKMEPPHPENSAEPDAVNSIYDASGPSVVVQSSSTLRGSTVATSAYKPGNCVIAKLVPGAVAHAMGDRDFVEAKKTGMLIDQESLSFSIKKTEIVGLPHPPGDVHTLTLNNTGKGGSLKCHSGDGEEATTTEYDVKVQLSK